MQMTIFGLKQVNAIRVGMSEKLATGLKWDGKITYISLNFDKGLKERDSTKNLGDSSPLRP